MIVFFFDVSVYCMEMKKVEKLLFEDYFVGVVVVEMFVIFEFEVFKV